MKTQFSAFAIKPFWNYITAFGYNWILLLMIGFLVKMTKKYSIKTKKHGFL